MSAEGCGVSGRKRKVETVLTGNNFRNLGHEHHGCHLDGQVQQGVKRATYLFAIWKKAKVTKKAVGSKNLQVERWV